MLLKVNNVHKSFGGIEALGGVSLEIGESSITGLIGPNGSGKTTLFNVISGFYKSDGGEIFFKGERIDGLPPFQIARKGLYKAFQITKIPKRLTVLENMLLAPKNQVGESIFGAVFKHQETLNQERSNLEKALSLLELVRLRHLANEYASELSGGQKKLLALGRLFMANPDLILLDEPTAGVNPTLRKELMRAIKDMRSKEAKTFLIVEHDMNVISTCCDICFVLHNGRVLVEGSPKEIQHNDKVLEVYLSSGNSEQSNS